MKQKDLEVFRCNNCGKIVRTSYFYPKQCNHCHKRVKGFTKLESH